jgi:hypothetical protein
MTEGDIVSHYLLATYTVEGQVPGAPTGPKETQAMMEGLIALEAEMEANDVFVFGGGLYGPDASTVITPKPAGLVMTDGPFVESKEHIAGFYVINADDLDDALDWARKVVTVLNHPIEVRPFQATGKVEDQVMPLA